MLKIMNFCINTILLYIYIFNIFSTNDCANILATFPLPGLSHFVMYQKVLKGLAKKGHQVDVVGHFPLEESLNGYNDISIRGSSAIFTNNFSYNQVADLSFIETLHLVLEDCGVQICENSFKAENMQKLKNSSKKYDLLITELFSSDCMLGWAWHFNVPSVVMTSSTNLPWGSDRFGLPDNPSYIPTYFVEYEGKMSFYERLINTGNLIIGKFLYYFLSERPSNAIAKNFFGEDMPDLDVLVYNNSLHLLNTHFSINNVRPLVPNVVEVAGIHIEEPKPVNKHFDMILETEKRGIIYLTTGSLILTETFPPELLQEMFDAFAELPYKVVWKAKKENFKKGLKFPGNIHFEPWMPQLDILCDPRVKLFVSHGGMMGSQEAIYCGVPIIGIPVFADQRLNIRHAESMGFAIALNFNGLTKDILLTALRTILNDPKYTQNAKKISEAFKDRPMKPLDTAIFWIEYVIRHKGAPSLQSPAKHLSWYQYYLIDVVAVVVSVPCILIYLLVRLVKIIIGRNKTKIKTN